MLGAGLLFLSLFRISNGFYSNLDQIIFLLGIHPRDFLLDLFDKLVEIIFQFGIHFRDFLLDSFDKLIEIIFQFGIHDRFTIGFI